jgi:hypothetical protein
VDAGRVYQVVLGAGCDGVDDGENLLVDGDQLQVVDPLQDVQDQVCQLTTRVKRGDASCSINPDGVCDVDWARWLFRPSISAAGVLDAPKHGHTHHPSEGLPRSAS